MAGIVGGGKANVPTVLAPVVMPEEDSEATKKAKKRAAASTIGDSGRASTILSDSDKLGGG